MKLEVGLDDKWINDYEDSIASLIKAEIDSAIRAEVSSTIRKAVKEHLITLRKQIETQISKTTPAKIAKLLENLVEVKEFKV